VQSTKFSSNLLDATKAFSLVVTDKHELRGLPDSLLHMFSQSARDDGHDASTPEDGPWRVTLDPPSYVQFMKYAANRSLREQLHRASITRASSGSGFDNEASSARSCSSARRWRRCWASSRLQK
jgi:oligopeptidase A